MTWKAYFLTVGTIAGAAFALVWFLVLPWIDALAYALAKR